MGRKIKSCKDATTGQKKRSHGKIDLHEAEGRASANGGPISLTDDLKGVRRSAGHG
jgi:hypothetical protein